MSDTIAAVATGNAVTALGIIRISGDRAVEITDKIFKPAGGTPLKEAPSGKLVYGKLFGENGELLDLCLAQICRAPGSITGENYAELQCHGSPVVLKAAIETLCANGARIALPGEYTKRAFLNGKMSLTEAEAVIDLIEAETSDCAANAAGQLAGAVSRKTEAVYSDLANISAHYHAVLDYPDEDIEDFVLNEYRAVISGSISVIRALLSTFERGSLMKNGIPAVIVGKPNAGKSSLLNALLGYDRAIVTDIPGTTRDTIEERIKIGAVTLLLSDTAGIRDTQDIVEKLGVGRSLKAAENAELIIAVIDGNNSLTAEDKKVLETAERAPKAIIAVSKTDLTDKPVMPESPLPKVCISSVTGEGIEELSAEIEKLFPMPQVPAGEIITNLRQKEALARAFNSLENALEAMETGVTPDAVLTETENAMYAIGELNGKTVREDITNRIFDRFCVGK
ncbi:MAG: tRNA uridine-5-carboxymethylaminomethyl(34) synthesis GTPase MnmE [Oscillospiraceae bacterium]|nr:tRNA uridine-5-carboxymethylaminomethyl(34) synthesis GTPase MnmE [Oscillospiraceae bacterium]